MSTVIQKVPATNEDEDEKDTKKKVPASNGSPPKKGSSSEWSGSDEIIVVYGTPTRFPAAKWRLADVCSLAA